jgi:hypothetical protein
MKRGAAKACAVGAIASGLVACATSDKAQEVSAATIVLKNPGFETASDPQRACALGWDCTMHADPQSFRFFHDDKSPAAGKRSFCIEPVRAEPWALVTQGIHQPSFRGAKVRFSIAVRVEGASGSGAGPWVLIQPPAGRNIHRQQLVNGTQGWQRVAVEVDVPADAQIIELGATLEGAGRACFDDARLELVAGSKNPV